VEKIRIQLEELRKKKKKREDEAVCWRTTQIIWRMVDDTAILRVG